MPSASNKVLKYLPTTEEILQYLYPTYVFDSTKCPRTDISKSKDGAETFFVRFYVE